MLAIFEVALASTANEAAGSNPEVGWNRELFVPMSVIRHRDFLLFYP
ncbi:MULTISPECIES: hypothetical protein [unclassified Enterococcus]|nr:MULTISPECIES: hypothetical protein [unclassified Enterococcus]